MPAALTGRKSLIGNRLRDRSQPRSIKRRDVAAGSPDDAPRRKALSDSGTSKPRWQAEIRHPERR